MKTQPVTSPLPASRSRALATDRIQGFLSDVRATLADGRWHFIKSTDLSTVHAVSNNVLSVLEDLKCIERRIKPGSGRMNECRRLPGLNEVTAKTVLTAKQHREKAYWTTYSDKQRVTARLLAENLGKPFGEDISAEVKTFQELMEPMFNPAPTPEEQFMLVIIDKDGHFQGTVAQVKNSVADARADAEIISTQLQDSKRIVLAKIIEVFTPVTEIKRTSIL